MRASKRILLTGAGGFLGSHLLDRWVNDGHSVAILKRRTSNLARISQWLPHIDAFDAEDGVRQAFASFGQIDAVVHTATNYGRGGERPDEVHAVNTTFALGVLQAAIDHRVPLFLNTATALDRFLNAYSLSKAQFSEWGRWLAAAHGIRFVDVQLEHMYGAGDDASKFTTHVIRSCLNNVRELQLTPGEQRRDFIFIDDVVDAYALLLRDLHASADPYTEIGLGSGEPVTIREFVQLVHRLVDSRTELRFGAIPYRHGEVMESKADLEGLKALGWHAKHSLEQGLMKAIDQERSNA